MYLYVVLFFIILLQTIIHYLERRDMYNRLMSKNLTEYKQGKNLPPQHIPSAHDRVISKWRKRAGDE